MRVIALIPARGGSKGIPRKNLQKIGDETLVGSRIKEARKSKCTEIFVSTEDFEISQVSKTLGAKVIERPMNLAKDETSTDEVLRHAINFLGLEKQDIMVLLQPTSPFINSQIIDSCLEKLLTDSNLNSVLTLAFGHTFVWSEKEKYFHPDNHSRKIRLRRQDMPKSGIETGGCYVFRVSSFLQSNVRFPEPTSAIPVNIIEAIDIDSPDDLKLAQKLVEINL